MKYKLDENLISTPERRRANGDYKIIRFFIGVVGKIRTSSTRDAVILMDRSSASYPILSHDDLIV